MWVWVWVWAGPWELELFKLDTVCTPRRCDGLAAYNALAAYTACMSLELLRGRWATPVK